MSKLIADSCNQIEGLTYHFKCQSRTDGTMILRMVEYDFMIALSDNLRQKQKNYLQFPRSCIIYLRSNKNTLSEETMNIRFADEQTIIYKVPVLKLKQYSIDEIFQKNLLILLPYYIINYEKKLSEIASNASKTATLLNEYQYIIQKLENISKNNDNGLFYDLIKMMRRIINYLLKNEPILKERLGDVMGGKVLPLPSDKIRKAEARGLKQGLEQGLKVLVDTLRELNKSNEYILKKIMEKYSLSEAEAKKYL